MIKLHKNITEHEFNIWDSTETIRWCIHCCIPLSWSEFNSPLPKCIERFNTKQFENWLEFHNYSKKIDEDVYVKRYSSISINTEKILDQYSESLL